MASNVVRRRLRPTAPVVLRVGNVVTVEAMRVPVAVQAELVVNRGRATTRRIATLVLSTAKSVIPPEVQVANGVRGEMEEIGGSDVRHGTTRRAATMWSARTVAMRAESPVAASTTVKEVELRATAALEVLEANASGNSTVRADRTRPE